ncbi:MAG: LCP family protein [Clostridiales bacterium]|uniref:LCP family protein n=1 Tax=Clostridium sp. N3C TaxID=1776758 RepID=UPI00092DECCB|nr:LCP family protein [Clostridium sp. N3C]NLZ48074.1 LCP family protein [Clostridiales bacterium]SCN23254.1 Regulatory protein MsrR [Clostridium sp. N3C]
MKASLSKKIFFTLFLMIFILVCGYFLYIYLGLKKIEKVEIPQSKEELGINYVEVKESPLDIRNIALFGIDTGREKYDPPHSDTIIILTIDKLHNKIKISSILRDSYVFIEGHGQSKITEAYTYGGPLLAVKTLNQNFNLDIKEYMTVDFKGLSKIIDALGGVDIEIKNNEIKEINKWTKELAQLQNVNPTYIKTSGVQHLNGIQAVAYSRIRNLGAGEFDRTSRQRKVLTALFNNIKEIDITSFPSLVWELTPYVSTNISTNDILALASSLLLSPPPLEEMRFPIDGYCKGTTISGIWYLTMEPDIETTADQITNYIYNDVLPTPKAPLF